MPYESKYYALDERGVRRMASQFEPPSAWGSALTIRVRGFRIERDDGNKSDGKNPGKKLRHVVYKESAISAIGIGRDFAREIYQDSTVVFEVQQANDGVGQRSAKL